MDKIWRVENKKGKGCYRGNTWVTDKHDQNMGKYPIPQYDVGIDRQPIKTEICGFINLKQTFQWFSFLEMMRLIIEGYKLKLIKVERITAVGEKQILAIRWNNEK